MSNSSSAKLRSAIVLEEHLPMNLSTSASKPKLTMRTLPTVLGNRSRGQDTYFDRPSSPREVRFFDVNVFQGPPNNPWTKQTLHPGIISIWDFLHYHQASGLAIGAPTLPQARCPHRGSDECLASEKQMTAKETTPGMVTPSRKNGDQTVKPS
ncbi:hypothetical protein PG993_004425 [Apiospora rasikravindrae]|uniref:Uncharacterized protein n=1 Tax=Apiospora rasikravindrae TaxID=990691 RepID=A0ABR1TCP8_9PEZI